MPWLLAYLAAAAGAAPAPSFACDRPATYAERSICADPRLAAYDRAMARLYRRSAPGAIAAQRRWLAERDRCHDPDCLLERHEERLLELAGDSAFPAPTLRSATDRNASLAVAPLGGGWFMFYATDLWIYPGGGNANTAESAGVFRLEPTGGEYRSADGCAIRFERLSGGRWRLTERSGDDSIPCGGLNTGYTGLYGPAPK